ncbi:hypothetical protein QBC40DRAFT_68843 [Triangularia verruculosa]|uniref:DNA/RNA-binding domain-containing protein n=1 Tax=Triangularia verruculosa TaxID=2587418 RepID=A0AAN6XH80_9PEZI|nr:hypothetical protein QBC40DRAFT_68843 [Triangularia verruculosa]
MDVSKKWNEHLRRLNKKIKCPDCGLDLQHAQPTFEKHYWEAHIEILNQETSEEEKKQLILDRWNNAILGERDANRTAARNLDTSFKDAKTMASSTQLPNQKPIEPDGPGTQPEQPSRRSTTSSKREPSRSRSTSPPKKSKARPESDRRPPAKGTLWTPDADTTTTSQRPYDKSNVASRVPSTPNPKPPHRQSGQSRNSTSRSSTQVEENDPTELIKQPETRPISQDQLVAEVKGIYAGLVMVESKCIEVDNAQNSQNDPTNKLNNEQWQALIALHRTLLHEHHDFFLASQHPSASPALRRLASKYAMPARMWRHGIHSFLELLRHRLPASLEHMLMFIYLAYSMMALLYETVPAFEDTWIECLGDLGRYRMAIEDDDIRDRENWTAVSRHWYSKASDKAPTTGRLYHHLAILARPNALQQLYYYTKSLCVAIPFGSARESIMTLFDPIMAPTPNQQQSRLSVAEFAFVKVHAIMFGGKQKDKLQPTMDDFLQSLDSQITRSSRKWLEAGYHMGISNCCAVIGYGNEANPVAKALKQTPTADDEPQDQPMQESDVDSPVPEDLVNALKLFSRTCDIVSRRDTDPHVLPFLHVTLVFIYHLTFYPEAIRYVAPEFPWKRIASRMNKSLGSFTSYSRIEESALPKSESQRPLPEDYAMRGLAWADRVSPSDCFSNEKIDDDEKYFEVASMADERSERVLWLGHKIATSSNKWLRYNPSTHEFSVAPEFDTETKVTPMTPVESVDMGELPDAAAITA